MKLALLSAALLLVPSPAVDPQNAALLAFKRAQSALWDKETVMLTPHAEYEATSRGLKSRATQIQRWRGDAGGATPQIQGWPLFQERAYFTANDGSAQPYWVFLPTGYTPQKKWPMVVFLHGYSPSISTINPWILPPETLNYAAKKGLILVVPYGRRNTDFVQWGEDDTIAVRNEVIRLCSVDENRVYLCGASMGGYGAYAVALHNPDMWAAVAPICGRTDFYLWFKIVRDELPIWKRALYDADDPRTLSLNARNTPFFVQHGALDTTVDVTHSRLYAADARVLGLPFTYQEFPDVGHWSDFQLPALERAFDWLVTQKKTAPPRKITLIAADLREAQNGWARIEAFQKYGELARLDVELQGDTMSVTAKNVGRFVLTPPHALFQAGEMLKLVVNGEEAGTHAATTPIKWQAPNAQLDKSPLRCGPFKNLMRDRFLLVWGNKKDRDAALRFAKEWDECADGEATLKAASGIKDEDKSSANLILFGTRQSNPLLAEIGDQLPLELTPTGYRMGTRSVKSQELGLRMVWKSPWNDKRLIGVCSGTWWGEELPINHKWDLIPDYIVYGEKIEKDDTNTPLEAGFWDGDWKPTSNP